MITFGIYS